MESDSGTEGPVAPDTFNMLRLIEHQECGCFYRSAHNSPLKGLSILIVQCISLSSQDQRAEGKGAVAVIHEARLINR